MKHRYRILVEGDWVFCKNGTELDTLVSDLLRKGSSLEEIEIEVVEAE